MKPYQDLFPDAETRVLTLDVGRRTGEIPKGCYRYLEYYCTDPGCDCRRVTLVVVNEKLRPKAVIGFGFDGQGPFAGPYLDPASYQSPFASGLLEFFVLSLNSRPAFLNEIYEHYRQVRAMVQQAPYRGKSFPEPGKTSYRPSPAPDLTAILEHSLRQHETCNRAPAVARRGGVKSRLRGTAVQAPEIAPGRRGGMARLLELYMRAGSCGSIGILLALQDELRSYLSVNPSAGEELAALLPSLRSTGDDEEPLRAALCLLSDVLDFYQVEVEGGRPGAKQQMQRFQTALLGEVFAGRRDQRLALAVARVVRNSRVRIIPGLSDEISAAAAADPFHPAVGEPPEDDLPGGIARILKERGVTSPFHGAGEVLDLLASNDPELALPIVGALLTAGDPFLREISALLLFQRDAAFALEVSGMLASVDGGSIGPETLRRLIISRNWFPDPIRENLDRAIGNARRARVACAPLKRAADVTVYAIEEDTDATLFQVVVPERDSYLVCSIACRPESGMPECRVRAPRSARDVERLLADLEHKGGVETTLEELDHCVCRALADGAEHGNVPDRWLLSVAEILGCDRWRGR